MLQVLKKKDSTTFWAAMKSQADAEIRPHGA
jgi:hypothetical protein